MFKAEAAKYRMEKVKIEGDLDTVSTHELRKVRLGKVQASMDHSLGNHLYISKKLRRITNSGTILQLNLLMNLQHI